MFCSKESVSRQRVNAMKEILPNIYTWSKFSDEKQLNFNGWYVINGEEAVIIDPPPAPESVLEDIADKTKPSAVILSNKDHARQSQAFADRFNIPIWIHELDQGLLEIQNTKTFKHGDCLPCQLKVIHIQNGKSPGESAFLYKGEPNTLIVGDAVIGKPAGQVSMLPDEKFSDPQKAKESLSILLEENFDALLLGDGESFARGGYQAIKSFLQKPVT